MPASPAERQPLITGDGELQPLAELNESRQHFYSGQGSERELSRRSFLTLMTLAAAGVALKFNSVIATPVAEIIDEKVWPDRDASIGLVNPKQMGVYSNRLIYSFPKFGDMDSVNPAHESYDAFRGTENLAYIYLPTHKFDEYEIAEVWWDNIQRYKVQQVVIEGHSAGMATGLMSYKTIHEHVANWVSQDKMPPSTTLPRLRAALGNCSPASMNDTFVAPGLKFIGDLIANSDFNADFRSKYLYSANDGTGDFWHGVDLSHMPSFLKFQADTWQQTFNKTAPNTGLSIGEILYRFNWLLQSRNYVEVLDPFMDAVQVVPKSADTINDSEVSTSDWKTGYNNAGVDKFFKLEYVDDIDPAQLHANSEEFAKVVANAKFGGAILVD